MRYIATPLRSLGHVPETERRGRASRCGAAALFFFLLVQVASAQAPTYAAGWAQTVDSGSAGSTFLGIAADASGGALVVGAVRGTGIHDLGDGIAVRGGAQFNAVLAKYGSLGTSEWARTTSSTANCGFLSVAVDAAGNAYVAGYLSAGTFAFGERISETTTGVSSAVVAKYDAKGQPVWVRTIRNPNGQSQFKSVCLDEAGNVYVAGSIGGASAYDLGNGVAVSGGSSSENGRLFFNAVLARYDSSGNAIWARSVSGGMRDSEFGSAALSANRYVYVSGVTQGAKAYRFGDAAVSTGAVGANLVLVKYDTEGHALMARTVSSQWGTSSLLPVAADPQNGEVVQAGYLVGALTYSFSKGFSAKAVNPSSWVALRFDQADAVQWLRSSPASRDSGFLSLAVDAAGNLWVAGWAGGEPTYSFGDGVSILGGVDKGQAIVVCFDREGTGIWASSVHGGPAGSKFRAISSDPLGNIFAVGVLSGEGTFDFGDGVTATSRSKGGSAVIAKWTR